MLKRIALIVALFSAGIAEAGQTCNEVTPSPTAVRNALTLAQRTRAALDASDGRVALVARAGQDLRKWNLRWSHLGFAWRDHPQGRWTAVHLLNRCGTAGSDVFTEGLGSFFLDDPHRYEALMLVPTADTQARLAALLSGDAPARFHQSRYNMVAYAFSTDYQNSNQWALELLAAAVARDAGIATRADAQAWLKAARYLPITVEIDALTRLGGRMFRANVAFDDHPFDRRMAGAIDTVTVESIERFLTACEPGTRRIVVGLP